MDFSDNHATHQKFNHNMMNINRVTKFAAATVLVFMLSACDLFDLDINTDPNNPAQASPELLLTSAEYSIAASMAGGVNNAQMGFCGLISDFDSWNLFNTTFNGFWNSIYAGPLKDLEGIIAASDVDRNNDGRPDSPHYLGIAQTLKAYVFATLVDLFGDVPFSEALQADNPEKPIKNPKFDKDSEVYAACIALLDKAIANLALGSPVPVRGDAIYNGNAARWSKVAHTLKLRMLLNTRIVNPGAKAQIEALLADPSKLISAPADDFQFQFSKLVTPDNRHPWYQDVYAVDENGFGYILHQLMVEMLEDQDPRVPFYFRRQTTTVLDQTDPSQRNTTPCSMTVGCQYGYLVLNNNVRQRIFGTTDLSASQIAYLAGFFGRDRADPAGIPLDGALRLTPGVYPAGGFYDNPANVGSSVRPATPNAAPGGGIFPILMSYNTLYYHIEAILAMGSPGDARALFETAIRRHIDKVVSFSRAADANAIAPSTAAIDAYVDKWLTRYDNASGNNAKLNVVLKQLWTSSWGNGYEIYNAIRRTGLPNTLQEPINTFSRNFPLRLPYPQVELTLNPNAASYSTVVYDRDPIFWDR